MTRFLDIFKALAYTRIATDLYCLSLLYPLKFTPNAITNERLSATRLFTCSPILAPVVQFSAPKIHQGRPTGLECGFCLREKARKFSDKGQVAYRGLSGLC
ncbi:hypothetical protein AVEN_31090-1 [Araneus ventricosus]|uniref:Uncharacterized protein n=1 Tax=Araneus ventricosus TaxID=182803 RepID=A0A4Y2J3X9_ARAVE|nr:hypothetical protein AVEN_31090-1 [Araneus ventricosus]